MFKVLKYLKKSFVSVIIIIVLLCLQAVLDLELPDYTSKIVNVGIQQAGIENPAPVVIRQSQMDQLLLFTNDDEKILENYTLLKKEDLNDKEYEEYKKDYPALETDNLYIINKLSNEEQKELNSIISIPIMAFSNTENIELISMLPEEQLQIKLNEMKLNLEKMPESIIQQSAIAFVKQEYIAIGINVDNMQTWYIILSGLKMLGVAVISMICAVTIMLFSSRVAAKLGKVLRDKVFKKVLSFSNKEFREFSTASLITRTTNDIQQVQGLMTMLFRVVVYAPIMGIGGFVKVLTTSDTSMAWVIGIAILAVLFIISTLFILTISRFKKLQTLVDKLNEVAREILTGLPVIRAFNTEKYEEERFDKANTNLTKVNLFVNRAMSFMMPGLMFVMNSIAILIIWVGADKVNEGVMQVGDLMAFIQYTMHIVISFLVISMISIILPRASVSANRIIEVLETKETIKNPKKPKYFDETKKGLVEFKNVSFQYPDADEEILKNITFTATPGKTTAIIGSTGSGKSTVVNLIPRFYDVTSGEILIDGVNIKDVTQQELRKKIGFVPQKGILFSGTIESNIKYGNENISEEEMKLAAEIAQASEFIEGKPDKYASSIAQRRKQCIRWTKATFINCKSNCNKSRYFCI